MNYLRNSAQSGINDTDVLDMRDLAAQGLTATEIGEQYGIDRTTAGRIITGRTWSHVPSPRTIGNYSVYPDGRVFSISSQRFMTAKQTKEGAVVELRQNGTREKISVANLVAKAFITSRISKAAKISFIDGNARNAHFTNLVVSK